MSVKVENLEHNMAKLTIEVPADEFDKAIQSVYNREKRNISIPGFRKGKVPRNLIEKMYGKNIFCEDAANDILPGTYADAVEESGLEVVSRPKLTIVKMENGEPFVIEAEVAVKPEVKLGAYTGVEVTKIDTSATEEEINKEIDSERERNARTVSVEDRPVQDKDTVVIDYKGTIDGKEFEGGSAENYSLVIGSKSFIPGFEDQLIGKESGAETEVNVTFPDDYQAEDLAGKAAVFAVKIHEIKTKVVPEFDLDFVQDVSEFDTIDEYKEDVRKKLETRKQNSAKAQQQDEAIEKIVENSEMDIPDAMIDSQCEDTIDNFSRQLRQQGISMDQYMQYTGTTMDSLKEQVRPDAVSGIEKSLVLDQIVKEEKFEVTDEELEAEIEKMAKMYQMEVDDVKKYLSDSDKESIKDDLLQQKAVEYVFDHVKFVEKAEEPAEEEKAESGETESEKTEAAAPEAGGAEPADEQKE